MKRDFKKTAFAAALFMLAPFAAQADPTLTVTGEGSVSAVPDEARLTAGVESQGKTAAAAIAANAEAMNRVFAALKALNVPDREIRTSNFSLQPQYAPLSPGASQRMLTGYGASNNVTVTLDDTSRVSVVLDMLIQAGANESNGVNFSLRDPNPLLAEARADAVKDAFNRAQTYAKAAGVTLGPIQSISDGDSPHPIVPMFAIAGAREDTPISPGEQNVSASITITWAIKPSN